MKRIVIMFLKNFYILPYYIIKLLYVSTSKSYAKNIMRKKCMLLSNGSRKVPTGVVRLR